MVFTHLESRPLPKPVHSVPEASFYKGGEKMQAKDSERDREVWSW